MRVLTVIAMAMAIAPVASAEPNPVDLRIGASFFARYEVRENYQSAGFAGRRIGELDGTAYRARIGLQTTPIEIADDRTVVVEFTPQASGFFGDVSGGLADAALGVHEANIELSASSMRLEVGRFEMAYGDHLVIGDVGWHETGRAFDGLRFRLSGKGATVDSFVTQISEGSGAAATAPGAGDLYFAGVYGAVGPLLSEGLTADGYLLANIAPPEPMAADFTAIEVTAGTRLVREFGRVTARTEAGIQFGKRPTADETVFDFQVDGGAMVDAGSGVKVGASGFYASSEYNQLYPTAHKFLGMMDVMGGRSNVFGTVAKVRVPIAPKLSGALDIHAFFRPETEPDVDAYTGVEGDLWGKLVLGKGLGLRAQYSLFLPNASGPLGTGVSIHYFELQLRFDLR